MVTPAYRPPALSATGPDQIDVEVGLNLRRARLARGYSQSALAEALGLSFQQVQKYERGANRISASMLVKSARFLQVPAAELLPPDDMASPPGDLLQRFGKVRGAANVANAYCAIRSPALRRALLLLMRTMAEEESSKPPSAEDGTGSDFQ